MARQRFIWQVFPTFLLITLISLMLVSYFVTRAVEGVHLDKTESDLASRAQLLVPLLARFSEDRDPAWLQQRCKTLGAKAQTRITVIREDGTVLADSHESPQTMENHGERPEILDAFAGRMGRSIRFSHTLDKRMMYVAMPPTPETGGLVVRVAIAVTAIGDTLRNVYSQMILVVILVTALAAILSWLVSRRVVRPLADLKAGAEQFARGQLDQPMPVPQSEEFASLTKALNMMALQLADHIQRVEQQRNEQEAVLSSMIEGVLAIDRDLRIITINDAASALLGVDADDIKGRTLLEVARSTALHEFARQAMDSEKVVETEIAFGGPNTALLRAQGTVLHGAAGTSMGAVVVLENITRLRQLEEVRQDFVANVSHELKTPITSIKGFVETLLDDEQLSPEAARHFLGIIGKQANRLDAIIEDLLTLSRLEQDRGRHELPMQKTTVLPTLQAATELCQHRADSRHVAVLVNCDETLEAAINPPLLEQGLVNLVDNAIKFSEAGQTVLIQASQQAEELVVEVIDQGAGIHMDEIDRIFERFYRVDRARSRDLGGTGLGLSIVKHIAQVHGGRVSVSSAPGEGSTFTIRIPLDVRHVEPASG